MKGNEVLFDVLRKSRLWVVAAIFAFCIAPTFISYQPYTFRWDDSEYLQRAIEVSRAFWSHSVHGIGAGMVSKRPPVMTLLGLPWGTLKSWDAAGRCFISLGAFISLVAALCLFLLLRIGVRPIFLLMASVCVFASIGPYPPGASAHFDATSFMADSLFAWATLAALLLISYEARFPSPSIKGALLRGFLWAAVFSLGAMTKISFLYFILLVVPTLFLIRRYRAGLRSALAALIALACCSAPATFYLARWGRMSFENGATSSFGRASDFYGGSMSRFLSIGARQSPGLVLSFSLVAIALVYLSVKHRKSLAGLDFVAPLIVIGFGIIFLASPNKQIRYAFPVIVALPFLIAIPMSIKADSVVDRSASLAAVLVFCGLLVAGAPMRHRANRQSLARCDAVLAQAARCNSKRILLATDSPTLNKNLMDLATEFLPAGVSIEVGTLAYQAMSGVPIERDFQTIDESDEVIFQDREQLGPPFTNVRVPEYGQYVRKAGFTPIRVGGDLNVYSMPCKP